MNVPALVPSVYDVISTLISLLKVILYFPILMGIIKPPED